MVKSSRAVVGALLWAVVTPDLAAATPFDFSYTTATGHVLTGMLDGTLQADGNTVVVGSVAMAAVDGGALPDLSVVESLIEYVGAGTALSPIVSLSGAAMDLIACASLACTDGFLFDAAGGLIGAPFFSLGLGGGTVNDDYDPRRWTLTAKALPETGSIAVFGAGLAGLALARRRRNSVRRGREA